MKTVNIIKMLCTAISLLLVHVMTLYGADVKNSSVWQRPESDYVIIAGEVELPFDGFWTVESVDPSTGVLSVRMKPTKKAEHFLMGPRMRDVVWEKQRKNRIYQGRGIVSDLIYTCYQYAGKHDNKGPASIDDLNQEKRYSYLKKRISKSPWSEGSGKDIEGPFVFLVPNVEFKFVQRGSQVPRKDRQIIAVELRPYVDDGKHWVGYTDRSCTREEIDPEFVKKHELEIRPVLTKETDIVEKPPAEIMYRLLAVREAERKDAFSIKLANRLTNKRISINWSPAKAIIGSRELEKELNAFRQETWYTYPMGSDSPLLSAWFTKDLSRPGRQRSTEAEWRRRRAEVNRRRRRGARTSVSGVLGGRAAVRETLQMQVLNESGAMPTGVTVPINTITGVTVKSHLYREMLKGEKGGSLAIADVVPHDRFFVYVAKPVALLSFLDEGSDFMSQLGGLVTSRRIDYHLKKRYLTRLGLNEQWLGLLLKSGAVKEMALTAPDMFFIDGTDITAILRVGNRQEINALLKMAGVLELSEKKITEKKTAGGDSVFWIMRDDFIIVSMSKSELEKVISLHDAKGKGSLGKSAEFCYMLTQLAPVKETRAYVFFSDPFIRRLVGPEVKIAQLRRMTARAEMEFITSRALLAKLDGMSKVSTLEDLVQKGYVSDRFLKKDYSINSDLVVRSVKYGTLAGMKTVLNTPIVHVTKSEAEAYRSYVNNYSRFWRQFFDPIAIRFDDTDDGGLEVTTFILPLIDSSIYRSMKQFIASREDGTNLQVPQFSPDPVVTLSLNLTDQAWTNITKSLSKMFMQFAPASSAMIDDFGPGIHFAVHDADPVIALGSGDIMGAFGANVMTRGRNSEMMFIPIALSVLTRPCTLAIETRNPQRTIRYLRQTAASTQKGGRGFFDMKLSFYEITGRDAWVCTFELLGMLKLRYGLEVKDGFLIIRNIPWSDSGNVVRVARDSLNGARLEVVPAGCIKQLKSLYAAGAEYERAAAMRNAGYLYPLLASGYTTIDNAPAAHYKLIGCTPIHPPGGKWLWKDYNVASSIYGSVHQPEQPDPIITEQEDPGLMKDVERLSLEMQFENTGLRTRIRWKTR